MSSKTHGFLGRSDSFPEDQIARYHSPEPWTQDGRYIRDANGAIVVRGRTETDARRIVAAVNATRDIPTDALEHWVVQDVSEATTRPDLEVLIAEDPGASPFAVRPPDEVYPASGAAASEARSELVRDAWPYALTSPERRDGERRRDERRSPDPGTAPQDLLFDRRVLDRRLAVRRGRGA